MKNYYTQLSELRIAEARRDTIKEQIKLLDEKATRITSQLNESEVFGTNKSNPMMNHVIQIEELEKKLAEVEEEIEILKRGLHRMDEILKNISGIEERIFRLYYIENKTPTQISFIIPCSIATVYRYKEKIEEKIKDEKK